MTKDVNAYEMLIAYIAEHKESIAKQEREFESKLVSALREAMEQSDTAQEEQSRSPKIQIKKQKDNRPRLTQYQYRRARDEGFSNEQIKERFRLDSAYQIGGYGRQYAKIKKAENVIPGSPLGNPENLSEAPKQD